MLLQLFFQKLDHIMKAALIRGTDACQGQMRGEDMLGLRLFAFIGLSAVLKRLAGLSALFRPKMSVLVQIQDVIQS